ncbi:unnamed protein product [Prorocentrum cordatum]|uniref:FAD/NAD(P)-binding domain-containing protein n=1 Tax=Prorocentrum cordatum TaxID=2364126 RepID=A0ABN9STT3_9DINO|nr:unnamed protein product [Polarella glacialis]
MTSHAAASIGTTTPRPPSEAASLGGGTPMLVYRTHPVPSGHAGVPWARPPVLPAAAGPPDALGQTVATPEALAQLAASAWRPGALLAQSLPAAAATSFSFAQPPAPQSLPAGGSTIATLAMEVSPAPQATSSTVAMEVGPSRAAAQALPVGCAAAAGVEEDELSLAWRAGRFLRQQKEQLQSLQRALATGAAGQQDGSPGGSELAALQQQPLLWQHPSPRAGASDSVGRGAGLGVAQGLQQPLALAPREGPQDGMSMEARRAEEACREAIMMESAARAERSALSAEGAAAGVPPGAWAPAGAGARGRAETEVEPLSAQGRQLQARPLPAAPARQGQDPGSACEPHSLYLETRRVALDGARSEQAGRNGLHDVGTAQSHRERFQPGLAGEGTVPASQKGPRVVEQPVALRRPWPRIEDVGRAEPPPAVECLGREVLNECGVLSRAAVSIQSSFGEQNAAGRQHQARLDSLVQKLEAVAGTLSFTSGPPPAEGPPGATADEDAAERAAQSGADGCLGQEVLAECEALSRRAMVSDDQKNAGRQYHALLDSHVRSLEVAASRAAIAELAGLSPGASGALSQPPSPLPGEAGLQYHAGTSFTSATAPLASLASSDVGSGFLPGKLGRRHFGALQKEGEHWDLVVVGGGATAVEAALHAARLGRKVYLVDPPRQGRASDDKSLGAPRCGYGADFSACLQYACSSVRVRDLRAQGLDDTAVWGRLRALCAQFAEEAAKKKVDSLRDAGVRYLEGKTTVVSARALLVKETGAGHEAVSTDRVLLATGSGTVPPSWVPKECSKVFDADTVSSLPFLPRSVAIVGSGALALEYAALFRELEAEVFLLEDQAEVPEPSELDADLHDALLRALRARGVRSGAPACSAVAQQGPGAPLLLDLGEGAVEIDCLLVAAGRQPRLEGLGLSRLPLQLAAGGPWLRLDERSQTSLRGIFAAGGAAGSWPSERSGAARVRAVVDAMFGEGRATVADEPCCEPVVLSTVPGCAFCGRTRRDAEARGLRVVEGTARSRPRGGPEGEGSPGEEGALQDVLLKLVFHVGDGSLAGVHALGPGAGELVRRGGELLARRASVFEVLGEQSLAGAPRELFRAAALDALPGAEGRPA